MKVDDWNIGWIATKRAIITPQKPALIYEDRPVTYKELDNRANRISHYLQDKGIKKGDRISVLLRNCTEFLEVYFAAAKLGIILVPMNFRLVGPELEYQLNNADSRLLVFHDAFVENIDKIRSKIKVEKDKYVYLKSSDPEAPKCPEWAVKYHDVIGKYTGDEPQPDEPIDMDDPLAIIYTSGATGTPKGAVLSHLQTYFKCFSNMMVYDMRANDIFLTNLPLCHSAGLFISATTTFCRGATLIMRERFEPEKFAKDIERYRATIVYAFTSMWRFILESGMLDQVDKSSARIFLGGGERTPQKLLDELSTRGVNLRQGYGLTENSNMMFMPKENGRSGKGPVGFLPNFFTDAWIENEQGEKLPIGEVGEIVAKGPTVMSGYWMLPKETARTIVNGALHTGDLAYRDEEGYFHLVDRAKDMYRSGGENVYPAEIEKVLANHPKIFNIAIIGVPDEKWGETGLAFIVTNEGEKLTKEEVFEFLKGKVAKYKFPAYVEFLDELPMTASGRIKKVDLREKYGAIKRERRVRSK